MEQGNGKASTTPPTAKVTCQVEACGKVFDVILPLPEIINGRLSSVLVMTHLEQEQCPYCGTLYDFKLLGIANGYNFAYAPVRDQSRIQQVNSMPDNLRNLTVVK